MTIRVRSKIADRFRADVNAFAETLARREKRSADLLGPRDALDPSSSTLHRALDELRFRHEELLVAEEELRTQVDALAQAGLRADAERERYIDLFDLAPDPYVVTDRSAIIRDANAAAVDLFAVELRLLRGKPLIGYVSAPEGAGIHAALDTLAHSGERTTTLECQVQPRGGRPLSVVARVAIVSRNNRIFWTFRLVEPPAVERRRDTARALRDADELLERERRLRIGLQRANVAKDRFIAVLSRDLRPPLNAILGWVQILRHEVLDASARHRVCEAIQRNVELDGALLDELVDISRLATERYHLELEPVDLVAIVARVVAQTLPTAQQAEIELVVEPGAPFAMIFGDPARLAQMLEHLLANALRFTPRGGRVAVAVAVRADLVDLVVRDNGRGIAPALQTHLFELPAHRVDSASPDGVGLYVVRRLAELQFASVRAESDGEGKGAAFIVTFPRHDAASRDIEAFEPAPVSSIRLKGLRVLVVDGDEDDRALVTTILERATADVRSTSTVAGALDLFRHGHFDVVVCDPDLHEEDGTSLVDRLLAQEPEIALLAVSSRATAIDTKRVLAAGFHVHLAKPCTVYELVDAVQRAADLRGSHPT